MSEHEIEDAGEQETDEEFAARYPKLIALMSKDFGELVGQRTTHIDDWLNAAMKSVRPMLNLQRAGYDSRGEVIEHLTEEKNALERRLELWAKRADSTLADEMAKNAQYLARLAEQKARVLRAELAVAEIDDVLRKAGIQYPLGKRGVEDLAGMVEGQTERAEEAERFLNAIKNALIEERTHEDVVMKIGDLIEGLDRA